MSAHSGIEIVQLQHTGSIVTTSHDRDNSYSNFTSAFNANSKPPTIPEYSLTAILPVSRASLASLEGSLATLLEPSRLREIFLLCPQYIISEVRLVLRRIVTSGIDAPDILLQASTTGLNQDVNIIRAAAQASTEWVLIMDQEGLTRETNYTRNLLLNPPAVSIPFGPKGVRFSGTSESTAVLSNRNAQSASYLLPPFVLPAATAIFPHHRTTDMWSALGKHLAKSGREPGAIVLGSGPTALPLQFALEGTTICPEKAPLPALDPLYTGSVYSGEPLNATARNRAVFVFLVPRFDDFRHLNPLACMLQLQGYHVQLCVYGDLKESTMEKEERQFTSDLCTLSYVSVFTAPSHLQSPRHLGWLRTFASQADVVLSLREEKWLTNVFNTSGTAAVLIQLSRADIHHSAWMSSLSLVEWRNWHIPRIDVSIITKDRPRSLARLLASLSNGLFFGDDVNLRLNLEQSSDTETMKMAENLTWSHGSVFLHHRIIQGGLLPAVVESWYPRSNDTYGLLLEDDVELSPLFYAWAKMSILRYRYGDRSNRSPRIFGISLYQQKNVELPPQGRRLFNARDLFAASGLPHPTTPYLSPIPCSWGAIYFPEHWREFHAYLSLRLPIGGKSEHAVMYDQHIVPNVRSNKWTRSWKKYFIELAYLRGYVMLYPNYPEFVSLSTNHLEVGSHVKVRTKEKQKLFVVPLMPLTPYGTSSGPGLLDMPGGALPEWDALPVLNLTGSLTTLEELVAMGRARRTELTGCSAESEEFDSHALMCIKPKQAR
ncbi:hypothetical protein DXG03_001565 [Asterophora parasitica]|uniref:Uncharacterized protein n=1 Tax=Asterophora parasitica TaxID=117018 RepID=A0A9P7G4U0_9AGAR|nr:hypothetical protein DXG03_001565 [Asterophora parasitica]